MTRILRAADLFCGAGGTSQGAEQSGAAKVVCAVNHWQTAVDTHSANFPHAQHINSRLDQVNPGECPKIDLLFASPECTHHSRARGGRPTSDQHRSGAWDLMRWIEYHRPSYLVVENVPEFREWGPVGKDGRPLAKFRGRFFESWVQAIQAAGYKVDHQLLNAADFGAATSRTRLFVIARKGNRNPRFPESTHSQRAGGELPGMAMKRWRAAAEIIDWSIPCKSVFARKQPLKDNTLLRIEAGLRRFVEPFVVVLRNNQTAAAMDNPLAVATTKRGQAVCVPFVITYYANGRAYPVTDPLCTISTRDRCGLAMAIIETCPSIEPRSEGERRLLATMQELGVADIGFRMLANPELSAAQGFPAEYIFHGNKGDVTKQIGNAVCPDVADAITRELAA